ALLGTFGALLPAPVWAYDLIRIGQVNYLQITRDGSFCVTLQDVPDMCPGSGNGPYACFVGSSDPNTLDGQREFVATLRTAKVHNLPVWLFLVRDQCGIETINFTLGPP